MLHHIKILTVAPPLPPTDFRVVIAINFSFSENDRMIPKLILSRKKKEKSQTNTNHFPRVSISVQYRRRSSYTNGGEGRNDWVDAEGSQTVPVSQPRMLAVARITTCRTSPPPVILVPRADHPRVPCRARPYPHRPLVPLPFNYRAWPAPLPKP